MVQLRWSENPVLRRIPCRSNPYPSNCCLAQPHAIKKAGSATAASPALECKSVVAPANSLPVVLSNLKAEYTDAPVAASPIYQVISYVQHLELLHRNFLNLAESCHLKFPPLLFEINTYISSYSSFEKIKVANCTLGNFGPK